MRMIPPTPSPTPHEVVTAANVPQDLWWAGYWAGFWACFWIAVVVIAVTLAAYAAGRHHWPFGIKAPSWWEHHDKRNLPDEHTPKLNGRS